MNVNIILYTVDVYLCYAQPHNSSIASLLSRTKLTQFHFLLYLPRT